MSCFIHFPIPYIFRDISFQISLVASEISRKFQNSFYSPYSIDYSFLYRYPNDECFIFLETRIQGLQLSCFIHFPIPYIFRDISFQIRLLASEISGKFQNSFTSPYSINYNFLYKYPNNEWFIFMETRIQRLQLSCFIHFTIPYRL